MKKTDEERRAWQESRGHVVTECPRCGEQGICEVDEEIGDAEYTEILHLYHNSDSRFDGCELDTWCIGEEDRLVQRREDFIDHHGRYPKPWEG